MDSSNSTVPPLSGNTAQYAVKKRRRPQAKKDKASQEVVKSNPSKRHRDRLNNELDELSQLIPLPPDVLNKLDKLSILRLVVSYLRNKNYNVAELTSNLDTELPHHLSMNPQNQVACLQETESKLALEALHGFLVVVNQDFDIFYVTESVQDYLGFPQSDMINLSMLDFVHVDDREIFSKQMRINEKESIKLPDDDQSSSIPEYTKMRWTPEWFQSLSRDGLMHRSFICRLRCLPDTSSGFLALHFTGHLRLIPGQNRTNEQKVALPPEVGLFLLASPLQSPSILEIRTKNFIFRTKHKLDYTPLGIDAKGKVVLGYTEQQLRQRSGYEFIHSADMMHCADAHTKLMRLGESGCTVFRLLHKDNRWVWVTASARLVYRNGQPDCIIATQKPIQDQEGEDELKKRSNAFRFDFTGQAILYGEVNPIGTRGGPEQNPLNDEQPIRKKQKVYDPNDVDRMTLFGAQSMQRMDIYMGNLPNQTADSFSSRPVQASAGVVQNLIKNEQISDHMGPIRNDTGTMFYPMGTELTPEQQEQAMRQKIFCNPNNYPATANSSLQSFQAPINQPNSKANAMMRHNYSSSVPDNQPPALYHLQESETVPLSGPNLPLQNSLKRPYPTPSNQESYSIRQRQPQVIAPSCQRSTGDSILPGNHPPLIHQQQLQQTHPDNYPDSGYGAPINRSIQNQTVSNNVGFNEPFQQPTNSAYQSEITNFDQPIQHFHNKNNKTSPSVLDSMTINSVVHVSQQEHQLLNASTLQQQHHPNANVQLPIPDQFDKPSCIGYQDNTIRFDLQKIAAEYQTTDPLSRIQDYMHDHPSHAAAIATGLHPRGQINEAPPVIQNENYISSCQFPSPQSQFSMSQVSPQTLSYPLSAGTASSSGVFSQSCESSDESYNNPSVGSKQAMSIGSVEDTLSLDLLTQQQLQQFPGYQQS